MDEFQNEKKPAAGPQAERKLPTLQSASPYKSEQEIDDVSKADIKNMDARIWGLFHHDVCKDILAKFNEGQTKDVRRSYELLGFAATEFALDNVWFFLHGYQIMTAPEEEQLPLFRAMAKEYFQVNADNQQINVSGKARRTMRNLLEKNSADLAHWKEAFEDCLGAVVHNLTDTKNRSVKALARTAKIQRKMRRHAEQKGKKDKNDKQAVKDKRTFDEYMHVSTKVNFFVRIPFVLYQSEPVWLGPAYRQKRDRSWDDSTFYKWLSKFDPTAKKFQYLTPLPLPNEAEMKLEQA